MRTMTRLGMTLATAAVSVIGLAGVPAASADDGRQHTIEGALVGPETAPPPPGTDLSKSDKADERVERAQRIMRKFGIPTGAVDGKWGPQTAQGLCAFRRMSGSGASRDPLDTRTYSRLLEFEKKYDRLGEIPASSYGGKLSYLHAQQTCQTLFYVVSGKYRRVSEISTGTSGHRTPNGTYRLGHTLKGWYCSSLYPDGCYNHTEGMYADISSYGNMYNPRQVIGDIFLHGSMSVPTYPASHGCIRLRVSEADWYHLNAGQNNYPPFFISGSY